MSVKFDRKTNESLFEYLLRLADDRLVLGHRLSEWCGHGPILEEDIALSNIALDLIGQSSFLLEVAGRLEGAGRSADDLAYFREAIDFKNVRMVELPRGDFAFTMARQFLFDVHSYELMSQLEKSEFEELAGIAAKAVREDRYHLRHSREWMLRLGDGTEESHLRIQRALDEIWMYTKELFESDQVDEHLSRLGIGANLGEIEPRWKETVSRTLEEATLTRPDDDQYMVSGSRRGYHSEHLGHLLAEMQILARSYPGAEW